MSFAATKSFFENLIASTKAKDGSDAEGNRSQRSQNHLEIRADGLHIPGTSSVENTQTPDEISEINLQPTRFAREHLGVIDENRVLADPNTESEDDDNTKVKTAVDDDVRSDDEIIGSDEDNLQDRFRSLLQMTPNDSGLSASESLGSRSSSKQSLHSSFEENTVFLVDVYKPVIKHHFKVTEILPYLPLIDKTEADMIRSKHNFCASDAVELLLDTLKRSKADGIWQSFLDALDKLEYTQLRKLITNETETHHSYKSEILRLVTPELQRRIIFPNFLDATYEKELLIEPEKEEVEKTLELRGSIDAAGVLLERVDKHKPDWDVLFVDILERSAMADIAATFRLIEENEQPKTQAETTLIPSKKRRKRETFKKRRTEPLDQDMEEKHEGNFNENSLETNRQIFVKPTDQERLHDTRLLDEMSRIHTDLKSDLHRISQRLDDVCSYISNSGETFINRTEPCLKCGHTDQV